MSLQIQHDDVRSECSDGEGSDSSSVVDDTDMALDLDERDSDEEELEALVLGNTAAFRESLFRSGISLDDDGFQYDATGAKDDLEDVQDSALFFIDTAAGDNHSAPKKHNALVSAADEDAPAWVDSDDERLVVSLANNTRMRKLRETEADDVVNGVEYARRLRLQYARLAGTPAWATEASRRKTKRRRTNSFSSDSSADSDDDAVDDGSDPSALPLESFLRDVRQLAGVDTGAKGKLRPEVIDIQRTREIAAHKGPISTLSFHPQYPVVLSSSTSTILQLNHFAPTAHPTPNPSLASVQIQRLPIRCAEFLGPDGNKIVFSGRRKYFHSWDLSSGLVTKVTQVQGHRLEHKTMERFRLSPCGQWMAIRASSRKGGGMLNILNAETMQWVAQVRVDSRAGIIDFTWWRTGEGLTILGQDGTVAEWSLRAKRTLGVWRDEGSIGGTVLALGGSGGPHVLGEDRWVAVGSNSGILNVYERNGLVAHSAKNTVAIHPKPEPRRTFDQLTTPISVASFTPDGQILAFGSGVKKDALRLIHLPSCTIYRNWPTEQTPLGRIKAVAFNKESNVLAVGNDVGKIRLWEIKS